MRDSDAITRRGLIGAGAAAAALGALPAGAQTAAQTAAAGAIERFAIWPATPPGGEGLAVRDEVVKRSPTGPADDIAWPHIATPMLSVVPAAKPNGAALLLMPGGGYTRIALGRGGSGISRMFAARGITVFELLYRLPHDGWAAGPDAPLQDAQRAMRLIRAGAARWKIDPAKVGTVGFSAGGHLAARLASRAALETYTPVDVADRQSSRPTVAGLFFPVITLRQPEAHGGSLRELLGKDQSAERVRRYSAEIDLPADMPPTFVAHAADDPVVKPANSLLMFSALQTAKIPSELAIFERGGHGLPLTEDGGAPHPWAGLFERFARHHGL